MAIAGRSSCRRAARCNARTGGGSAAAAAAELRSPGLAPPHADAEEGAADPWVLTRAMLRRGTLRMGCGAVALPTPGTAGRQALRQLASCILAIKARAISEFSQCGGEWCCSDTVVLPIGAATRALVKRRPGETPVRQRGPALMPSTRCRDGAAVLLSRQPPSCQSRVWTDAAGQRISQRQLPTTTPDAGHAQQLSTQPGLATAAAVAARHAAPSGPAGMKGFLNQVAAQAGSLSKTVANQAKQLGDQVGQLAQAPALGAGTPTGQRRASGAQSRASGAQSLSFHDA